MLFFLWKGKKSDVGGCRSELKLLWNSMDWSSCKTGEALCQFLEVLSGPPNQAGHISDHFFSIHQKYMGFTFVHVCWKVYFESKRDAQKFKYEIGQHTSIKSLWVKLMQNGENALGVQVQKDKVAKSLLYTRSASGEKNGTKPVHIRDSVVRETANLGKTSALFLDLPTITILDWLSLQFPLWSKTLDSTGSWELLWKVWKVSQSSDEALLAVIAATIDPSVLTEWVRLWRHKKQTNKKRIRPQCCKHCEGKLIDDFLPLDNVEMYKLGCFRSFQRRLEDAAHQSKVRKSGRMFVSIRRDKVTEWNISLANIKEEKWELLQWSGFSKEKEKQKEKERKLTENLTDGLSCT